MPYVLTAVKNFTAGQDVSIVRIGVTSDNGCTKVISATNKREYSMAETMMIKKYSPASGTLFSDLVLI